MPHLQAAEGAILYWCKQERAGPTLFLTRPFHDGGCQCREWKHRVSYVFQPLRIPSLIRPERRTPVVVVRWTDELLYGGEYKTNGCLDFSCRAFPLNGQMSAEWSRCPGSMARHARYNVAPIRRSSAGCMPARIGRLLAQQCKMSFPPKPRWMNCKHCNAQLLPDCECLTSNNRFDSDLQFALPKTRSNSGAKTIKHSAIEIWSRIPLEIKNKTCLELFLEEYKK